MLSRLTFALLISGFVSLNSFGRLAAQPAPTPLTNGMYQPPACYALVVMWDQLVLRVSPLMYS